MVGGWPYEVPKGHQSHPWTSDWYKLQPWEENDKGFYWNVQVRRYGGDLQGVIDKLDYLKNLGINAIYFNPLFEAPSLHKYDATFYHHIDNNFGPDPKGDKEIWQTEDFSDPSTWKWTAADKLFLKLIEEAHIRNIKVIIDGVFNHVGRTFWAFQDVFEKQENSKFKNWFTINSFDNPNTDSNEFDYEGWIGIKELPEINENQWGLVEEPANHIHSVIKRWMDPNNDGDPSDGIDGWRLDVAEMVNHEFWKKFRIWVKEINPEAYITGEIWWDDWKINKMMVATPWLMGDQFDAVMNYRFTRAVKRFISDQDSAITSTSFIDTINTIRKDYNEENLFALMNLLGSHDTERLSSMIINHDNWYDHGLVASQSNTFEVRKPTESEREKQKLMVGLQMTMPGAPMIYYGDEVGMWGGDDPDCRKPMIWAEMDYENETTHPFGLDRPNDSVNIDSSLLEWYRKIISIRNTNEELRSGELNFLNMNYDEILGFERVYGDKKIFVLLNNSHENKTVQLQEEAKMKNLLNEKFISNNSSIELHPYEMLILK